MLITTKDEAGRPVQADVDDNRIAVFQQFINSHPDILGNGAGGRYGRSSARDATEAAAFAVSQLAYVEQKTYERQYLPLTFETLLGSTISYAAGEWAQSIEYQIVDYVGMGKRMSPSSNDVPFVDVAYTRKAYPVANGGIGYFYTQEDLRTSAYLQRPLPTEKLATANVAYRRHINRVALQGEAASNFTGLFNAATVTAANRPSGAVWDAATPATIIADFMAGMTAVMTATQGNSMPRAVALPIASYQLLLQARSTTSDTTILGFLKSSYPGLEIYMVAELVNLGAGATKRMVFFNPLDDNMILHLPMPLRFLAPQMDVLRVVVPGEYKYAGLEIRRPPTTYYMDGI